MLRRWQNEAYRWWVEVSMGQIQVTQYEAHGVLAGSAAYDVGRFGVFERDGLWIGNIETTSASCQRFNYFVGSTVGYCARQTLFHFTIIIREEERRRSVKKRLSRMRRFCLFLFCFTVIRDLGDDDDDDHNNNNSKTHTIRTCLFVSEHQRLTNSRLRTNYGQRANWIKNTVPICGAMSVLIIICCEASAHTRLNDT